MFLRSRAFLLLQTRQIAAGTGYTVYLATILWLTYRLTGGIFLAGIVVGVETAVYALTFVVAPLVDRVRDKRWVYLACYPIQAAASVALGLTYVYGLLTVPLLLFLVVVLAVLWDFSWAADATATRLLFGKEDLFTISGLGTAIGGVVDIALYFTAGVTIALFGAAGGSYLYATLLAAGAGLALLLPILTPNITRESYWAGFRAGWQFYRGEEGRPLRHLAVLQFIYGFFSAAPLLLLTLYAGRYFANSQTTYAELYVAYLIGGMAVGLVLGRLNPRGAIGTVALFSLLATGLLLLGAEFAAGLVTISLGVWFLVGVTVTSRLTAYSNYLQGRFAPGVLARIAGNNYLFTGVSSATGAALIGVLSTVWSPSALTELAAVGFIASAAIGFFLSGTRSLAY